MPNFEFHPDKSGESLEAIDREVDQEVPEACADCAVQCELASRLSKVYLAKLSIEHFAEDKLLGEGGAEFDAIVDDSFPSEVTNSIKQGTRQEVAQALGDMDDEAMRLKNLMHSASSTCSRPLKMRASKEWTTYTVTVCTSPLPYINADARHVPTHLSIKPQ